jgi:hypothetical protein
MDAIQSITKINNSCKTKGIKYCNQCEDDTVFILQMFYIFVSLFWILLISYFKLWDEKLSFILFLPLVAFFITFLYIEEVSDFVEENMTRANFLSLGFIIRGLYFIPPSPKVQG